jgi:hypothetical protein
VEVGKKAGLVLKAPDFEAVADTLSVDKKLANLSS